MSAPIRMTLSVADNDPINLRPRTARSSAQMTVSGYAIGGQDKFFAYTQGEASARWEICHNLRKYPSVTVVDSANTVVVGDVEYIDENNIVITFSGAFSGMAYMN